ncbi:hypothetical protein [Alteribacter populi]|uniref:hypothetical protein n=1 Tax=Alteribacter populi TaxID=2011011 RepID=UPI0012FD37B0|nr:hypothetical protein [Alteribacter populi]
MDNKVSKTKECIKEIVYSLFENEYEGLFSIIDSQKQKQPDQNIDNEDPLQNL